MDKKKIGTGLFIAAMAPFLTSNQTIIINPALASISTLYPGIPFATFTWVSTIASLFGIVGSFGAGAVAGKKLKIKTTLILALLFMGAGGLLPMFVTDFTFLLVCRAFVGCGVGMVSSIGYPMVYSMFQGDQATKMTGLGTSMMNLSGVVLQLLAGVLVAISLNAMWLINLLPVILIFFVAGNVKSTAAEDQSVEAGNGMKKKSSPFPGKPIVCMILFALMTAGGYPLLLNMSAIVLGEGLGSPSVTGVLSALFSVGGILAGVLFAANAKLFKNKIVPVACATEGVGILIAYFSHNVVCMGIGLILMGIGNYTVWPGIVADFNTYVPEEHMTMASSLAAVGINAGMFLGSPFILAVSALSGSDSLRLPLLYGGVGLAICTVVWFFVIGRKPSQA